MPVIEKTTDTGTKKMLYDKQGKIAAAFDQNDQNTLTSSGILKGRLFTYDIYGRAKGQYRFEAPNSTSIHPFTFVYQRNYVNTGPMSNVLQTGVNSSSLKSFTWTSAEYTNLIALVGRTALPEKIWGYSLDQTNVLNYNKMISSESYNEVGGLIQFQQFEHDAQERVVAHTNTIYTPASPNGITVKMNYEYNFAGALTAEHVDTYNDAVTDVHYYYGFDNAGRLRTVSVAKGTGTAGKVAEYIYHDATNLLKATKYFSNNNNVLKEIQNIDMSYDIRDRLKNITSELMNYTLYYDNEQMLTARGLSVVQSNNWNGNINGVYRSFVLTGNAKGFPIQAGVTGPTAELNYGYRYDKMNRLTAADAAANTTPLAGLTGGFSLAGDEYSAFDAIGNFTSVTRNELTLGGTLVVPKIMNYTYANGNNRLANVLSANGNQNFTYDGNGNLLTHSTKQLTATTYTRATYPAQLTAGTNTINYYYDATDQRIFKRTTTGGVKEELYFKDMGGKDLVILTKNGTATATAEYQVHGANRVAIMDFSKGTPASTLLTENELTFFHYDHLGNTRMAFGLRKTAIRTEFQMSYVADYYAYGKVLRSYTAGNTTADRYPTTGHERDDETGFDYRGARFYDGEIGRFLSLDPLAADYVGWSPYHYVLGNPIMYIDPTGMKVEDWVLKPEGEIVWDPNATSEETTQKGDRYIGPTTKQQDTEGNWINFNFDGTKTVTPAEELIVRPRANLPVVSPWMETALGEYKAGVREVPLGSNSGPRVNEYLKSAGATAPNPWCAAFVHWCLAQNGIKGAGAKGKNYLKWGVSTKPKYGAIAVFKTGHVGFYMQTNNDGTLKILHGNWSNKVTISSGVYDPIYPSDIQEYRYPSND